MTRPTRRKKPKVRRATRRTGLERRQNPLGSNLKVYNDADGLASAITDYILWNERNPVKMKKIGMTKDGWDEYEYEQPRAMTIEALCVYIGTTSRMWRRWRDTRPELKDLIEATEDLIFSQKFEYAALDVFNANLIARSLGLADRAELTGRDGGPLETRDVSPRERLVSKLNQLASRSTKK